MLLDGFLVATGFAIVKLRMTQAEHLAQVGGLRGRLPKTRTHLDAQLPMQQHAVGADSHH